jgi:hypothetical protein
MTDDLDAMSVIADITTAIDPDIPDADRLRAAAFAVDTAPEYAVAIAVQIARHLVEELGRTRPGGHAAVMQEIRGRLANLPPEA